MEKHYEDYKRSIKGLTKEEAIKKLERFLFLIQQDNYMDWKCYKACKEVLEEVKNDD